MSLQHTTERFPRCYSESVSSQRGVHGVTAADPLSDCDRIETVVATVSGVKYVLTAQVGEVVDRARHVSESAVGVGRRRAATFSSELSQLRGPAPGTSAGGGCSGQALQEKEAETDSIKQSRSAR